MIQDAALKRRAKLKRWARRIVMEEKTKELLERVLRAESFVIKM